MMNAVLSGAYASTFCLTLVLLLTCALGYRNPAHQPQRLLRMHDLRNTACFERLDQSQAVCQLPLHCECSALTSHPLLGPPEEVHASMRTAVTTTRLL